MPRYKILFVLYIGLFPGFLQAGSIKGKITLNDSWEPVVYLSVIHDFDDLHTAAYNFLRYQTSVDSVGYFEFRELELTEEDLIYRLHICKKGDPVSTILIGGQDENFIHFIMNNAVEIELQENNAVPGLPNCTVIGDPSGSGISKLLNLKKRLNTPLDLPSEQNRDFVNTQILEDFHTIIDTSNNGVVPLLALHFIGESFANIDHLELMDNMESKLAKSENLSPYYEDFLEELSFLKFQNKQSFFKYSWLKWSGGIILLFLVYSFWLKMKKKQSGQSGRTVLSLSKQEKRVYNLLKEGKSNKEISSELHIEVSTVKSHLNKIYSRLGVKSRKEIVDKELQ